MSVSYPAGPWTAGVVFSLPTPVASKSNHRNGRSGKEWRRFKGFEEVVYYAARAALPANWPALAPEQPLARRPVVAIAIAASTRLDASNLSKSVADALEGVCYANDASARAVVSIAVRLSTDAPSDPMVGAAAFDPGVSLDDLTIGVNALLVATVAGFTGQ